MSYNFPTPLVDNPDSAVTEFSNFTKEQLDFWNSL